jgi:hypothetical protein
MPSSGVHPPGHAPFALFNRTVNVGLVALLRAPILHHLVSHGVAEITVTGRRSGLSRTLPVFYRQQGDTVRIQVAMAQRKLWWRNLRDPGAEVHLLLRRRARSGYATLERPDGNHVLVLVHLDPA